MYIGRGNDAISNVEKLDNITFNGGTTYALTKSSAAFTPVGANNLLISIDGVIQQGNFSVSTTNVVFDFSPTSSNTCDFILHYGTGVLNVPADGSVSQAKLGSEAVNESKMQISNAGSDGNFLQKQSSNSGGLTWASASADADNYFASSGLSSKDLGEGLHIKNSDSGLSSISATGFDNLIVETSGNSGMMILSGTSSMGGVMFGDSGDDDIGNIIYNHNGNYMAFSTNAAVAMNIDSIGAVTKPLQPAFLARDSSGMSNVADGATIAYNSEIFDQNADFNTTNYTFTAPVTGRYFLSFHIYLNDWDGDGINWFRGSLVTSNRTFLFAQSGAGRDANQDALGCFGSILCDMDASDTATVRYDQNGGSATGDTSTNNSWFSGHLVA